MVLSKINNELLNSIIILVMFMIVRGLIDAYVCFCFSYPDQMHYATNRQDQVFNIKA